MSIVIELKNLSKYYGNIRGIENLNVTIQSGEIFGFLGPNGAGKSTTIRLLLHLLIPSAGSVKIFGKNIHKNYAQIFSNLGNVPGELALYEELTGYYFLSYMNSFSGKPIPLQENLINDFQLTENDLGKKIKHFSRGMKQKIAIIQAMQEEPELLIMDEPSEGLDPINKNILYHYLLKFKKKGHTIFFSSHNLSEVEKVCDRVALVKDGKLIALESISNLKQKMIRRMEIHFRENINPEDFNHENVIVEQYQNHILKLCITGDVDFIIKKVSKYKIKNLIFPNPTLEDTFMTYYQ